MRLQIAATFLSSAALLEDSSASKQRRLLWEHDKHRQAAFSFLNQQNGKKMSPAAAAVDSAAKDQPPQNAYMMTVECDPTEDQASVETPSTAASAGHVDSGLIKDAITPAACSEDHRCHPSDKSTMGGICVPNSRELQDVISPEESFMEVLNKYCSPDGARYGDCTDCPSIDENFDPTLDGVRLSCAGKCASQLGVDLRLVTSIDPETNETSIASFSPLISSFGNCSDVQNTIYSLCQPGTNAASECDCPADWKSLDVEIDKATVTCPISGEGCIERFIYFPGNNTVQAVDTIKQECIDEIYAVCDSPACDCSNLTLVYGNTAEGTIRCTAYECLESTFRFTSESFGEETTVRMPDVPCVNSLEDLCNVCNCDGIDQGLGTGSGECSTVCGGYSFTAEGGDIVARDSDYCLSSAFGKLCFSYTLDDYVCPTLNGVPCACALTECGRSTGRGLGTPFDFTFDCGNGVTQSTCNGILNDASTVCPLEIVYDVCFGRIDRRCDCSGLDRDAFGITYKSPVFGNIECDDSCPETIEFFGSDYTFQRQVCHTIYGQPGVQSICEIHPHPLDGACAVSNDGSPCMECQTVSCESDDPGPFDVGTSFVCTNATTGVSFEANTCQINSCPIFTDMPTITPSLAPSMEESMAPSGTPPSSAPTATLSESPTGTPVTATPVAAPVAMPTSSPTTTSGASKVSFLATAGFAAMVGALVAIAG